MHSAGQSLRRTSPRWPPRRRRRPSRSWRR
nr:MAG TPA: hypothetical protein [Caudoviricetes sp.]DAX21683.1 MAG TPA: hypothetical protein [Caudoviricetes sp.]